MGAKEIWRFLQCSCDTDGTNVNAPWSHITWALAFADLMFLGLTSADGPQVSFQEEPSSMEWNASMDLNRLPYFRDIQVTAMIQLVEV